MFRGWLTQSGQQVVTGRWRDPISTTVRHQTCNTLHGSVTTQHHHTQHPLGGNHPPPCAERYSAQRNGKFAPKPLLFGMFVPVSVPYPVLLGGLTQGVLCTSAREITSTAPTEQDMNMAQQLRTHTATGRKCSYCGKTLFDTGYGKALTECSKACKNALGLTAPARTPSQS